MSDDKYQRLRAMTVAEVRERVEKIRAEAADDEAAHSDEDELWQDVLWAVSFGHPLAADLAAAALATTRIHFSRWCA